MIIDTHCHLDHNMFKNDVGEVIARALLEGIGGFVLPGADPDDLEKAVALAEQYPSVFFAVGVHPYEREKFDLKVLKAYSSHEKCIAIGECGLDYYRLPEDEEEKKAEILLQQEVFREHVRYARETSLPLIVHIRDASANSKTILLEEGAGEVGGVLHCYNADEQLLSLAQENFYFGIGGVLTFKNARKLPQVLPKIPKEKLLIETDAPYLTPHPFRGKRNEPLYTTHVVEKMAEVLEMTKEDVESLVLVNTKDLFKAFAQFG